MQILQKVLQQNDVVNADYAALAALQPNLVLAFGSVTAIESAAAGLVQAFPQAHLAGCSTAGEISDDGVADGSLVVTACILTPQTCNRAPRNCTAWMIRRRQEYVWLSPYRRRACVRC